MDDDPSYDISITRVCDTGSLPDDHLVRAVEATLNHFNVGRASISVAIVDDAYIEDLNRKHLGHEGPTDVLTFDLHDGSGSAAPSTGELDGEIVVSIDTARREADLRGHPVVAELSLYLVHGTLHLLGHEDDVPDKAAHMHEIEDEVLSSIGVGRIFGRSAP